MKNNKKGFTLIELIIVMAILSILMVGIFAIFKPVGAFHVNRAEIDKRYTSVQGINDYIEDQLKFAKSVYVLDNFGTAKSIDDLKIKQADGTTLPIKEDFMKNSGLDVNNANDCKKVNVIAIYNKGVKKTTIDGSTYKDVKETWGDTREYTGRVYRVKGTEKGTSTSMFKNQYLALGSGYYGQYTYEFNTVQNLGDPTKEVKSSNDTLVMNTKIYEMTKPTSTEESKSVYRTEMTSRIKYLNSGKAGSGVYKYFNRNPAVDSSIDEIKNAGSYSKTDDNIYILYVNP